MAGPLLADRIKETTTTTGTGTLTLLGAATGFRSFSVFADADTCYYVVVGSTGEWEVGLGTVGAVGTTLARTTVLSSSNAGSAVDFAAGTKQVFCDLPASRTFQSSGGTLTGPLLFTDNTYDIGALGATRPRTGYFGTRVTSPEMVATNGSNLGARNDGGLTLADIAQLGWTDAADSLAGTLDVMLRRNGAGILALKNGANAQAFLVYGTETGSKYASLSHDGTNPILGSSSGGLKVNTTAVAPASSGTRYLIIDTAGLITSSASAPSGT